ncbi:hypothetical protein B0J11DRAFT_245091 [Dendryphion nanum]|uniref:Fungal N-terminal domain-containing protein n=1 Tax=Dendryphion nanum TaxID=256645 RepID=A0A9P9E316_9PLEO|nr:hypothetical protein B0J11DRAFT_245091 [Dendryphion nanum]
MAEISGLTVGVVSLGIQVCKGLISYYTQFRNAGEDIKDVVISIEGLQATLKTLELVKTRTVDPNNAISKQAEKAMKDCNDGLNRLDTMRRKCLDIKLAGNLQDKIKHAKNRLFWPFRKDTLNDIQNVVDRLQENLQLAVQLLGIDIEDQHHRELSNLIVTKSDGIDNHLGNQDAVIQGIHTDISNLHISQKQQSASAALQYQSHTSMLSSHTASLQGIQGGVSGLSVSLQDHEASMNLQLATQNSLLVSQTANLKDAIDVLIKSNQTQQSLLVRQLDAGLDTLRQDIRDQLRGPPQIQPISQEEILNSFSNQCSPFQRRLRTYNNAITGLPKTNGTTCTCLIRGQRTWSRRRGWIFSTISRSFYSHAPECLQFSHSDFSVEIEKEFKVLSWWCLSIGFSKSREVGKMKMYPSISFRSMVSRDSPSFQPFIEAENWIYDEFWGYRSKSEMIDLFSNLVKSVRQSIEEGKARPTDTLPDGSTLMHSAIELTFPLRSHLHHDQDVFDDFLISLIGLGVPTNEADDDGR